MATVAANVQVASTGGIYAGPSGTALATTEDAALNVGFVELGLVSEDGVTETQGTDTNDIRAWQNGAVVRRVQTSHDLTYQFTAIETNPVVLEEFYGDYDAATARVRIGGTQPGSHPWVIEVYDGDEHHRIVIPDGQITERGDVVRNGEEATAYPMTITCYPDSSGFKAYVYYAHDNVEVP